MSEAGGLKMIVLRSAADWQAFGQSNRPFRGARGARPLSEPRTQRVFERSKRRFAWPLTPLEDSLRARLRLSSWEMEYHTDSNL